MAGDPKESWEKFLNPETLKRNLIAASVFIVAFEMFCDSMTGKLRILFTTKIVDGELELSDEYKEKVLSLDRKELGACAIWFQNVGAFDDSDVTEIRATIDYRNSVAHELPRILMDSNVNFELQRISAIINLSRKLDRWWIREIEVPSNPDFDNVTLTEEDYEQASSLLPIMLEILLELAEGNDSRLVTLYELWQTQSAVSWENLTHH